MSITKNTLAILITWFMVSGLASAQEAAGDPPDLWKIAHQHAGTLRFSTLFTAQDVDSLLAKPGGTDQALAWCRDTGVTHVYIESFRGGHLVEKNVLEKTRQAFLDAGLLVSGCITTTGIGRKSVNGWEFPCFSEAAGRRKLNSVFAFTAGIFDEIMIDDFFATKCECDDCVQQRGSRSWSDYRLELLADVSRRDVLEPARRANPKVKIILKYPQWYDQFHERGYDVAAQPAMFDTIWVGTETREPDSQQWGRKTQYEAYFIMRWLGEIGGPQCGGGWFDPYGTKPATYVEQARQTILGGAREAVLFCYSSLIRQNGPENIKALRSELPALFELAELIKGLPPRGIDAPKPPNSPADGNEYIYDFIGMLGLPLLPTAQIRAEAPALFLPYQALKDRDLDAKIEKLAAAGAPILFTTQLAAQSTALKSKPASALPLEVPKDPWQLMQMDAERLQTLRTHMLKPLGVTLNAPTRVALYLFGDDLAIVENFNDREVNVQLSLRGRPEGRAVLAIPARTLDAAPQAGFPLPPRSLLAMRFGK